MSNCAITFLGTAGGLPTANRGHASLLFRFQDRSCLFDCGEPASDKLKACGVSSSAFERVFISHLHADHCGGLLMLIQYCWIEGRRNPLEIYMPQEGIETFRQLLRTTYMPEDQLPFRLRFLPLKSGRAIRDGANRVTPHPTTHLGGAKPVEGTRGQRRYEAFCFEICVGANTRIAYSGDIGSLNDLDPLLSQPLDLLIVEQAHHSVQALFNYLHHKPIRRIILTHHGLVGARKTAAARLARRYFRKKQLLIAGDGFEHHL